MKFVALLSGGKDSVYNLCRCMQHGHELVAAANLVPPNAQQEIDSFMYQSAGHVLVAAIAECLGVPLVRREIRGTAVEQGLHYTPTEQDEVEDLFLLLQDVKDRFPEVEAVAVGAILSNYQRDRVENVCERLGLTCLAFLWQRDQKELLQEMVDYGIEAVLCKVAAAGLDPYVHLGKSIRQLQPFFLKLNSKFGFHVCGEGGEYETLVLDCPAFQKRIKITESGVHICGDDQTVGLLSILAHETVPKDPPHPAGQSGQERSQQVPLPAFPPIAADRTAATVAQAWTPRIAAGAHVKSDGLGSTGLIVPVPAVESTGEAVKEQTRQVLERMTATLAAVGSSLYDVVIVRLYLRDIGHFSVVNAEYCTWFGKHPPSRCCVAVRLPPGVFVQAEAVFFRNSAEAMRDDGGRAVRRVLHVRSISEWAPVCIGPYSQANVLADCVAFVAGQIGLNPATMQLVRSDSGESADSFAAELQQSVANTKAILEALDSSLSSVLSCVCYVNVSRLSATEGNRPAAELYAALRQSLHNLLSSPLSDEDNDAGRNSNESDQYSDDDGQEQSERVESQLFADAPMLIVPVDGLPRDALVEIEVIAATSKQRNLPYTSLRITGTSESPAASSRVVQQWPIWQFGAHQQQQQQQQQPQQPQQQEEQASPGIHAALHVKFVSFALASIAIDIRADDNTAGTVALADIARAFMKVTTQAMETSSVCFDDLLFVQCYYEAGSVPVEVLAQRIGSCLPGLPPISFIPVPQLPPQTLLQVRAFAMNAAQLETEIWTRQRI